MEPQDTAQSPVDPLQTTLLRTVLPRALALGCSEAAWSSAPHAEQREGPLWPPACSRRGPGSLLVWRPAGAGAMLPPPLPLQCLRVPAAGRGCGTASGRAPEQACAGHPPPDLWGPGRGACWARQDLGMDGACSGPSDVCVRAGHLASLRGPSCRCVLGHLSLPVPGLADRRVVQLRRPFQDGI